MARVSSRHSLRITIVRVTAPDFALDSDQCRPRHALLHWLRAIGPESWSGAVASELDFAGFSVQSLPGMVEALNAAGIDTMIPERGNGGSDHRTD